MIVRRPAPAQRDARGEITDLLERTPIDAVTLVTQRKGAVRGNHYHLETEQHMLILSGRLRMYTQMPGGPAIETVVAAGDLVTNPPTESHAFLALEDASFVVFTRGPRGGREYETDTFRLETPLCLVTRPPAVARPRPPKLRRSKGGRAKAGDS